MDKFEAYEQKLDMWRQQRARCFVCNKPMTIYEAQLAHVIPKHKKYIKKYGEAVIHHRFNMRITCDKCNCKVLLDPATHPIEAQELIDKIKKDLGQ